MQDGPTAPVPHASTSLAGISRLFQNRLLTEIQAEDLRALCTKIKERGAPATAVQLRDIVKQVYVYAIAHGEKVENPADSVGPSSIATLMRSISRARPGRFRRIRIIATTFHPRNYSSLCSRMNMRSCSRLSQTAVVQVRYPTAPYVEASKVGAGKNCFLLSNFELEGAY